LKERKNYKADSCIIKDIHIGDYCYHHVKKRSNLGTDDQWNMMPLCVYHHGIIHLLGVNRMIEKYPEVRQWLNDNGWQIDEYSGKFIHTPS
jgi:hypothetical protein